MSDELRRALKDLSPPPATPMISWGEAKSVDADAETCTVDVDGLIYEDVPLSIGQTGICIVPEENSLVLVCDIENTANIAILKCQEVKKIKLRADLIEMNGGENSGLVLVEKLTEKLNKIEKDLNALKQVFSSWTRFAYIVARTPRR